MNVPRNSTAAELAALGRRIRDCTLCELWKSRKCAVPGEGPQAARIMLIGEAPGRREDVEGRPFVGPAGRVLEEALRTAGSERADVFITNIVKCRPPANRPPHGGEVETCVAHYLERQIELVRPAVVGLLGRTAAHAFFPKHSLERLRSNPTEWRQAIWVITYHPAAARRNPEWYRRFQNDVGSLVRLARPD